MGDETFIGVESGTSMFDGKPFVTLVVGEQRIQMRPAKAREIAQMILESAEASVQDSVWMDFAGEIFGDDAETAGRMLLLLREKRGKFDHAEG